MSSHYLNPQYLAQALFSATRTSSEEETQIVVDWMYSYLSGLHKEWLLPEILTVYNQLVINEDNGEKLEVFSRYPLEEEQMDILRNFVEKKYNIKKFFLINTIKDSLLGGVQIKMRDTILDISIDRTLKQLSDQLLSI